MQHPHPNRYLALLLGLCFFSLSLVSGKADNLQKEEAIRIMLDSLEKQRLEVTSGINTLRKKLEMTDFVYRGAARSRLSQLYRDWKASRAESERISQRLHTIQALNDTEKVVAVKVINTYKNLSGEKITTTNVIKHLTFEAAVANTKTQTLAEEIGIQNPETIHDEVMQQLEKLEAEFIYLTRSIERYRQMK